MREAIGKQLSNAMTQCEAPSPIREIVLHHTRLVGVAQR
jgi:hypothetical protein